MIEGAGVTDGSITHILLFLPANFCRRFGWKGFSLRARDSFPFILQRWIRPFLRIGARRIGAEKFGVLVVAYLVGSWNTLLDGPRLEVSSWKADGRLDPKFAADEFASPISVVAV